MREKPGDNCVWYDSAAEEEQNCDAWWTPGYPDATYAACAVVNGVDRKQLFIDDGTARWAALHRWGALFGGGMFTNVLLQAILYLRAAMLRGLAGRSDARLMAAIRVFIALECVGRPTHSSAINTRIAAISRASLRPARPRSIAARRYRMAWSRTFVNMPPPKRAPHRCRAAHRAVPSSMKSCFRSTPLTTAQAAYVASGYPGVHHASQFCSSSAALSYQTQLSPGFSLIIALRSFRKKN